MTAMPRSRSSASRSRNQPGSGASCVAPTGVSAASSEVRDASPDELDIDEINAGLYAFDAAWLRRRIEDVRPLARDRRALPDGAGRPGARRRPGRGHPRGRRRRHAPGHQRPQRAGRRRGRDAPAHQRGAHACRRDPPGPRQHVHRGRASRIAPDVTIEPDVVLRGATVGRRGTPSSAAAASSSTAASASARSSGPASSRARSSRPT